MTAQVLTPKRSIICLSSIKAVRARKVESICSFKFLEIDSSCVKNAPIDL